MFCLIYKNTILHWFSYSTQSNNKSNRFSIWVYNLQDLDTIPPLVFNSISEAAKFLNISRTAISKYLDSNKPYNYKFIFSTKPLDKVFLHKLVISEKVWEVITGELLGDGHINYHPIKSPNINGRLEFTFSAKIVHYVHYLKFNVLSSICTKSPPFPWPNKAGNPQIRQYWFSTKRIWLISDLHKSWYKLIEGKYIKVIPENIEHLLTPLAIAHWIMGDGYFSGSVLICTDNFTRAEVLCLIDILLRKFKLKAKLRERKLLDNKLVWRIYINKSSLNDLKKLVLPYMIQEMLYKLGIK